MTTLFVDALQLDRIADLLQMPPNVTQWQRLESEPAELDLAAGLEARLADPLWLIGRQWQFAELKGEDAGMPVLVTLVGEEGDLILDGVDGRDALPEVRIEAEPARDVLKALSVEAALDLREALEDADADAAFAKFQEAFPLELAPSEGDVAGHDLAALLGPSALDAPALAQALEAVRDGSGTLTALPGTIHVTGPLKAKALAAASNWLEDWNSLLVDPQSETLWKPERLEYSASMTAATAGGIVPLSVPEYANGRFDWWAIDVAGPPDGSASAARRVDAKRVPTSVKFPGMAADRLFEIEPDAVGVLGATAGPTGLLSMLLIEYAVAASNDWYQIPLTLPYGTSFRVASLTVQDSFEVTSAIPASSASAGEWSMFQATASRFQDVRAPLFLLPAATAHTLEGEPIEEVAFFRDEMANLAWAVERQLPGLTAVPVRPSPGLPTRQSLSVPEAADAALIYRLQTPLPHNWYPLAPEARGGAVGLRLRPLKRFGPDGEYEDHPTAGVLQTPSGADLVIEEREIPRSGVVVTRNFQAARDSSGHRHVWMGRRKQVGRGEGASNLRYDQLDSNETAG